MLQKIKNIYHFCIAILANIWFGFPSRRLIVIGVTGTDGKTTTASLIYHILKTSGFKVSLISSVAAIIYNKQHSLPFHVTTLPPFALQKFIKMAASINQARNGKKYLVLEVTSHALDQFRAYGTDFDIGVITNVSNEHLDYHKTYKEYVKTKLKLLRDSRIVVINKDDKSYRIIHPELKKIINRISRIVTYGFNKSSDVNLLNSQFQSKLFGEFNKYNILAAYAVAGLLGIKDSKIRKGISSFNPPVGRQEIVYKKEFQVMIDFAHTPNSFKEVLNAVKSNTSGKIIHVFGAAGERDMLKRPEMGRISSEYSDIVILTAEDPRSENVKDITDHILSGIKNVQSEIAGGEILRIEDRQEAIRMAIDLAEKNDFVIITGKAHEKSMNYGNGEKPWDEYKVVAEAIRMKDEKN